MSTTDCRTLHVYRLPVYQKRVIGTDNCIPNTHTRSPSLNKSVLVSRRRHSTPPVSTTPFVDINSPSSTTFIKYYHPQTRTTCMNKDQNPVSDPIKSPPRPVSLVKLRHQEDRICRMVPTPTSINSFTDIILPVAKKNRNTIVETPSSVASEIQSVNRNILTAKRGKILSVDLERDVFVSDEDSDEKSIRNDTSKLKSIKWRHRKCPSRFSHCNSYDWYCNCPFGCWIICFLIALTLIIGLLVSLRLLSN